MPKVKFTLDGTRGFIQELVDEDGIAEFAATGIEKSVYARRDYVDSLVFGSGSGGNVSLTGSNIFGSSASNTHQFTGSVLLNNGITGSLLGTASFSSNSDLLDGLDSTVFAKVGSSNTFTADQIINGNLTVNGTASINLLSIIYETSSIIFTSGSTKFGNSLDDRHQFTGSVLVNGSITGSLFGTASFASDSLLLNSTSSNTFAVKTGDENNFSNLNTFNNTATFNSSLISQNSAQFIGTSFFSGSSIEFSKLDQTLSAGYIHAAGEITSSIRVSAPSLTGSLFGTASFALTASSIDGLNPTNIARTDIGNTFNGNQIISGSLTTTQFITASITGSNINGTTITGQEVNVDFIDFNISASAPTFQTGRIYFDVNSGDLQYNTDVSPNTINLGQQTVVKVKNSSGAQINKGKLVRISGGVGTNPLISTASYENDNNSANTLGMVMNDIAQNDFGYVLLEGVINKINTEGFAAGQILYLSSSGDYTNIAPLAPKHAVRLGEVITVHQNQGVAFIRVQNGYELGELHDVSITSASTGDLLSYNTNGTWINSKTLSGSYGLSGSINVSQGITGSITGSLGLFTTLTGSNISASVAILGSAITQNNQATTKQYVDNISSSIDTSISNLSSSISSSLSLITGSSAPTGVIFVAKNGNDNNTGAFNNPVLTIGGAISKIKSYVSGAATFNRANILVAPGTYTENITIEDKNIIITGLTTDKEDISVNIVGTIKIFATGSRGATVDSVGIQNIKINDSASGVTHLISLTGSAPNASGIFLNLSNVLVAKVNSASSNASGLFIDTSYSNKVRIRDCRFFDQNGGGSPLVHFKASGASASIDIYDTKFQCGLNNSNLTAGPLIKTEGNCFIDSLDRCILETNSQSGAINIGAISAASSANIANCSIVTTSTGSVGIKVPVTTNIVLIRNIFTVTGSSNLCVSGSSLLGSIIHTQNVATPTVLPQFNYSTIMTGSTKISYTAMT